MPAFVLSWVFRLFLLYLCCAQAAVEDRLSEMALQKQAAEARVADVSQALDRLQREASDARLDADKQAMQVRVHIEAT